MTTKTKKTTSPKFVKPNFQDAPLSILYSCRLRLNEDERKLLKEAYAEMSRKDIPAAMPSIGGSSISVKTTHSTPDLDSRLNMSRLIFTDLINSRESINLSILIKIQQTLNVEIITAERLQEAFDNYLAYIFTQFQD